jgi:hypothetical protein
MAAQLDAELDTAQVAFASVDGLRRMQDAVRVRALIATYEYSVLGKAIASTVAPQATTSRSPTHNKSGFVCEPPAPFTR